jgi:hypothetical protein
MADEIQARVYGMADQANRHPPSAEGLRGEKPSTRPRNRDPQFSHAVRLDSGRTVVVSEGSGVAYAEATGRIGGATTAEDLEVEFTAEPRRSRLPLILGALAAGGAAGLYLAERRRRASEVHFEAAGQEHISDELPLTGQ